MTQEALKLALETAEGISNSDWRKWEELASPEEFERWVKNRALHMATAIKEALAQPEQEPYGIALTNIPHPQGVSAPDDLNADALEVVELELPDECEAVGWADDGVINWIAGKQFKHASFLYPTPPQRTFVGLTDKQIDACWNKDLWKEKQPHHIFAKAIELKLKELNT